MRGRVALETLAPLLAAALLLLAFTQPTLPWNSSLYEHVVVLDVTQSMNVEDTELDGKPASRLDFAKRMLHEALVELPCGSKLGWAIFTEYRSYLLYTPVEVCANRAELRASLAGIDGRMAWSGNSEIAKGLHSSIVVAKALPGRPSVVFVTDGHESPPLNPRHRPRFDDKPGEVPGVVVGVGDTRPQPIPKVDPSGRPLGLWNADEVLQTDPRSQGRGGSVGGERMVDDGAGLPAAGLGATPGVEHLSGLREPYLKLLAAENGFGYLRLAGAADGAAWAQALKAEVFARPVPVRVDLRVALSALAFVLVAAPWVVPGAATLARRVSGRRTAGG